MPQIDTATLDPNDESDLAVLLALALRAANADGDTDRAQQIAPTLADTVAHLRRLADPAETMSAALILHNGTINRGRLAALIGHADFR